MERKEIIQYVFSEAAKSNVEKRKVGCVIVDAGGCIVGKGFNGFAAHAEIAAAESVLSPYKSPVKVYVSQPPCPDCAQHLLNTFGLDTHIEVVKEFMKFDGDKVRYDLVPPSATKGMAEVLTLGARKYKPNNWKQCEEPERYLAAMYRHLEAWRAGEVTDQETGLHHLAHAMTNIAFMLELGYNPTDWSKDNG